ncbi:MAG: hypothetical protein ABI885_03945 [Gammaproteobacteria bacterium]
MKLAGAAALILAMFAPAFANARELDRVFLFGSAPFAAPAATAEFTPPPNAMPARSHVEGRLRLLPQGRQEHVRVFHDDYFYAGVMGAGVKHLPDFDFEFVQDGAALIPVRRGPQQGTQRHWEWVLEPGAIWNDPQDGEADRVVLPFSLQERNANCLHNGLLTFLLAADGKVSRVAYQIGSETCMYLKADLWGTFGAEYVPQRLPNGEAVVAAHRREVAARLPVKPIESLGVDHPGAAAAEFGNPAEVPPEDMTAFGFVIDGTHYVGGCMTRFGPHPFCAEIDLPSYSLAKTLVAGFAAMRLEKLYPGVLAARIGQYVPECARASWQGVTFENALDMVTGNYSSPVDQVDEAELSLTKFFGTESHAARIKVSCRYFRHQSAPGTQWVYHTSDTYVLGTALQAFVHEHMGAERDVYQDVLVGPLWHALGLSPLPDTTRRTRDAAAQPFTAYGLTLLPDDVARIGVFLTRDHGRLQGESFFDEPAFESAMQRTPENRGVVSVDESFRYNNGLWAHDVSGYIGCSSPVWVPYMVGYGGITVLLLPNDTVYYYFSDGGVFSWSRAVAEANRIRTLCPSTK